MKKTVSVVIPIYNEESRLRAILNSVVKLTVPKNYSLEKIIFVDDASTDLSYRMLLAHKEPIEGGLKNKGYATTVEILSYPKHVGYKSAVLEGNLLSFSENTICVNLNKNLKDEESIAQHMASFI